MKSIIIAFKSRNNLQLFAKTMRSHSIPTEVISTPRSVSISCGLSAKTDYRYLNTILNLLQTSNLNGFLGIYLLQSQGLHQHIQKLY